MDMLGNQQKPNQFLNENQFGVQETMLYGIRNVKNELSKVHPLAHLEENFELLQDKQQMAMLDTLQGQHASFKLRQEYAVAQRIGRLPCLKSSNLMKSVLKGTDELLEMGDVLNNQREYREYNIDPHNELYKLAH